MRPTPVLVTVTGRDRLGVTAVIFAALAAHDVEVRDVVQTVRGHHARLTVFTDLRGDTAALRRSVDSTAQAFGVRSRVEEVQTEPVLPTLQRPRSRPGHSRAFVLAPHLRAGAIGDVAKRVSDVAGNIEAMWLASHEPFDGLEMFLAGDAKRLRSALIGAATEDRIDVAVEQALPRTRARRLVVLDAEAMLAAGAPPQKYSPRVTGFVRAAKDCGYRVGAVGPAGTKQVAAALELDAAADKGTASEAVRAVAAELDIPMTRVVGVGDGRRSVRMLECTAVAIAVDGAAAVQAATDVSGESGYLDSVPYLLEHI